MYPCELAAVDLGRARSLGVAGLVHRESHGLPAVRFV